MEKFKIGDKFIPRKPKENYTHLFWDHTMDQYDGQTLIVQFATDDEITASGVPFLFHPDWCEKVSNSETPNDHIPDLGKMIDWEQRRYELAKEFTSAIISNPSIIDKNTTLNPEWAVKLGLKVTDEMIKQLKQK